MNSQMIIEENSDLLDESSEVRMCWRDARYKLPSSDVLDDKMRGVHISDVLVVL